MKIFLFCPRLEGSARRRDAGSTAKLCAATNRLWHKNVCIKSTLPKPLSQAAPAFLTTTEATSRRGRVMTLAKDKPPVLWHKTLTTWRTIRTVGRGTAIIPRLTNRENLTTTSWRKDSHMGVSRTILSLVYTILTITSTMLVFKKNRTSAENPKFDHHQQACHLKLDCNSSHP